MILPDIQWDENMAFAALKPQAPLVVGICIVIRGVKYCPYWSPVSARSSDIPTNQTCAFQRSAVQKSTCTRNKWSEPYPAQNRAEYGQYKPLPQWSGRNDWSALCKEAGIRLSVLIEPAAPISSNDILSHVTVPTEKINRVLNTLPKLWECSKGEEEETEHPPLPYDCPIGQKDI